MKKPMPRGKGNRTTFNYTREMKKIVEEKQKEEAKKLDFEYKVALSSLGIEVFNDN